MSAAAASSAPRVGVVWFTASDLRLHDHEPLAAALASCGAVAPLFVFDGAASFGRARLSGLPRVGAHRARFLLEGVAELLEHLKWFPDRDERLGFARCPLMAGDARKLLLVLKSYAVNVPTASAWGKAVPSAARGGSCCAFGRMGSMIRRVPLS